MLVFVFVADGLDQINDFSELYNYVNEQNINWMSSI